MAKPAPCRATMLFAIALIIQAAATSPLRPQNSRNGLRSPGALGVPGAQQDVFEEQIIDGIKWRTHLDDSVSLRQNQVM